MAESEWNFGFVHNDRGQVDIHQSPFFDVGFDFDDTVEGYLNRILPTLVDVIDEQFEDYSWTVNGYPSVSPPPPSTFLWLKTIDVATFLMPSFGVLKIFSR
ncbi:hypothetical protein MA16_Dca025584 [Dendrobium catenatum]|uniref:Uncharacterized protein n=1 Tax=Dendrobium catenatum TaxID=906689 RepID=A0A2I0W9Q3_9ASPA|nr:hypothetical protein MA16_Dca025584 [Dendrobium catenatum]